MNYVFAEINARRKQYTDMKNGEAEEINLINKRMLSLEEYYNLARRIITKWAPSNIKFEMLNSEDALDFVAHKIMVGDWGYNPIKSSIKTCRGYCGKMAIQDYIQKINHNHNFIVTNFFNNEDIIVDNKASQPSDNLEKIENRQEVIHTLKFLMKGLSETQRSCIIMNKINGMSPAKIGRELGMTGEGVRRSIQEAIKVLKNE